MSAWPLSLEHLQRWMQAAVVQPGSVDEAVRAPEAAALVPAERVGEVLLPNDALSSLERLEIYQGMYLMRMEEALESDYPGLQHFLGPRRFFELVRDYVQVHPSRTYTLNRLGDFFPEFVGSAACRLPRRAFCHDLARLELAAAQVFDAEETETLSAEAVAQVPAAAWETARLVPIAAFRLLTLRYPANDYLQSVRDGRHDHPKMRARASCVAVYRRHYVVRYLDLSRAAHDLLAALAAGIPLGQAVASVIAGPRRRAAVTADDLFQWFRQWVAAGMFRAVSLKA